MRELRFRVWGLYEDGYTYIDKENQSEAESFWDKSCIAVLDEKHIVDCWTDEDGEGEGCEYCDIKEVEAIEQYIGLKDKNGKEIYDGDIVLDYYDGEDTFIVEWDKDTASFILTDTGHISNVSFDNFYSDKDLEVIGNIHENPELLNRKEKE